MFSSEASVKQYIYEWLTGLGIGEVFQDRRPFSDTTKLENLRTYIVMDFPRGIEDEGPYYYGECYVYIGCRDKERFIPNLKVLDKKTSKFLKEFDKNDEKQGISCIAVEYIDDYSDGIFNHEYQYVFDVYARKADE